MKKNSNHFLISLFLFSLLSSTVWGWAYPVGDPMWFAVLLFMTFIFFFPAYSVYDLYKQVFYFKKIHLFIYLMLMIFVAYMAYCDRNDGLSQSQRNSFHYYIFSFNNIFSYYLGASFFYALIRFSKWFAGYIKKRNLI